MIRLGVLGSTRGTNLLPILDAIQSGELDAQIEVVLSNKSDAVLLQRSKSFGLPCYFVDPMGLDRGAYDRELSAVLREHGVELVVLIGYMRILSAEFVEQWKDRIINVHPSLLPAFAGLMDTQVHQAVLDAGVTSTGCTVHLVTENVDAGPIVVQKMCPVLQGDTVDTLKARVQALEGGALVEAIRVRSKSSR